MELTWSISFGGWPDERFDIDRLRLVVDAAFAGIDIQTSNGRLVDFIDSTGLVCDASGHTYRPGGD